MPKYTVLADSHRHLTKNAQGRVIGAKTYKKGDVIELDEEKAAHLLGTGLIPVGDEGEADKAPAKKS